MLVSTSVVIRAHQLVKPLGIAAVAAVLYLSWLLAPVPRYLGENEWRVVGFCAAIVTRALIGFWLLDTPGSLGHHTDLVTRKAG